MTFININYKNIIGFLCFLSIFSSCERYDHSYRMKEYENITEKPIIKNSNEFNLNILTSLRDPFNFSNEIDENTYEFFKLAEDSEGSSFGEFLHKIITYSKKELGFILLNIEFFHFRQSEKTCTSCSGIYYNNGLYFLSEKSNKTYPICMSCYLLGCTIKKESIDENENVEIECCKRKVLNRIFLDWSSVELDTKETLNHNNNAETIDINTTNYKSSILLSIYYTYRYLLQSILYNNIAFLKNSDNIKKEVNFNELQISNLSTKLKNLELLIQKNPNQMALQQINAQKTLISTNINALESKNKSYLNLLTELKDAINPATTFDLAKLGFLTEENNLGAQFYRQVVNCVNTRNPLPPILFLLRKSYKILNEALSNNIEDILNFSFIMHKLSDNFKDTKEDWEAYILYVKEGENLGNEIKSKLAEYQKVELLKLNNNSDNTKKDILSRPLPTFSQHEYDKIKEAISNSIEHSLIYTQNVLFFTKESINEMRKINDPKLKEFQAQTTLLLEREQQKFKLELESLNNNIEKEKKLILTKKFYEIINPMIERILNSKSLIVFKWQE